MNRSGDTANYSDFRDHLRAYLAQVCETGRPLFVSVNGETEAVVLSPAAYSSLVGKAKLGETMTGLVRSQADIAAGRTQSARSALQRLADELDLPLAG